MTFHIERRIGFNQYERISNKEHTSAEYAKDEIKKLYEDGDITQPRPREYRIYGSDGIPYHQYKQISRTGRFIWEFVPPAQR